MKSKVAAGILAIFLGDLGIHKFYLGKGGMGVLYLLFCWTFIPGIIGFIEGIILLTMDEEKFNDTYNRSAGLVAKRDVSDELEKLHGLKEKGVISSEEFEKRKTQLLR